MKTLILSAVAALSLLVGAAHPSKAETPVAGLATTAIALSGAVISGAAAGKTIVGAGIFMIGYCQYNMKTDANGNVVSQHPDCGGGGPVFVGSTTVNPYVAPAKVCTKDQKRGWQCPS